MSTASAINLFTVSPRSTDPSDYWRNIEESVDLSEANGYTGMLIFTGNDTFAEPWVVAQRLLERTERLMPLVAINPIYAHPFTVAKQISSFAYVYGRATALNMVAGAALSYQQALGDDLEHGARYDRLGEFLTIVKGLVTQPRYSQLGDYYQVENLQLRPTIPAELQPQFLLSGQSDAALKLARRCEATSMQMLPGPLARGIRPDVGGIHFGVIARPSEAEAWEVARSIYRPDPEAQMMLEMSMENTDATWKRRMKIAADNSEGAAPGYWLEPFRNFKADCPYFVGSYAQVATLVEELVAGGIGTIILDLPPRASEFEHSFRAVASAGIKIRCG